MSCVNCFIALGDTGGVPYDILQPVLEKYDHQKPNSTFINLICAMPVFLYMYLWKFSIGIFSNSVCSHLHDISE